MENKALFTLVRQILLQNEQVAIPGFGGFVLVYEPAAVQKDDRKISGPRRKVSFNPSLQQDDGILTEAIGKEADLSKEKATEELKLFVQFLDKQLSMKKELTFEGIGRLVIDEKGTQTFEAAGDEEFNADTYGLLAELTPEGKTSPASAKKKSPKSVKKAKDPKPAGRRRTLFYIAGPALLVVALLVFGYFHNWFTAEEEPLLLGNVEQTETKPAVEESKPASSGTSGEASAADTKEPETEEAAEQIQSMYVSQGSYYIIAGSFAKRQNALQKMEELNGKKYQTEIHPAPNGYFRVSIGSYKTKEEALKELQLLKQKMPDLWLWKKQ